MSKTTRIILALGLILALAAPAFAGEFKFSGFYQLQAYSLALKTAGTAATGGSDGNTQQFVDQRLRFRPVYSLNDNVAIVYQGEIDTVWGAPDKNGYWSKGSLASGGGGTYDTDGINIETKNLFLELKSGDTAAQIGLFNASDEFQGLIYGGADMAGVLATHKMGDTSLKLVYAKWDEDDASASSDGTNRYGNWDDTDFYGVVVSQKFSDAFKAGLGVYYIDDNDAANSISSGANENDRTDRETFFYGATAEFTSGNFGVDGFVLFQDGKYNVNVPGQSDIDTSAWAASVKGKMKLENGDLGLRVIYISDDDDTGNGNGGDADSWYGNFSAYDFVGENQMIFLTDKFVANATKERYAMDDAATKGFGLLAFVLSGNHKLPNAIDLNWGAGYYRALEDTRNGYNGAKPAGAVASTADYRRGKTLGYELAARLTKKFFEKVEVSLNAAYADFGDFYDDTTYKHNSANVADDPDAIFKTYLMVRVPF